MEKYIRPPREEFYQKVVLPFTSDECLFWPYARNENGYGIMGLGGRNVYVHRRACLDVNGEPPTSKHEAAHNCGNGTAGCVNPHHVRWATRRENIADTVAMGRVKRGAESNLAKLTEDQAMEAILTNGRISGYELAKKFGVSYHAIYFARIGKSWKYLHEKLGHRPIEGGVSKLLR